MAQQKAYQVETYDRETGTSNFRTVTPLPVPQRLTKPAPLTLEEIKTALIETGNEIDAAQGKYKTDTESLDAFYAEQKTLREEIAELQAKLNERQAELRKLEERGTPRDIYAASIVSLERQVTAWAGNLLSALREQAAQRS
jgi:peptidoglycan hydrolase CwlO-like protein